ncbi:MAG: hypothetical protein K6F47_00150 [Bacteroidaceae bacterium]|nr:hypothetical protein [Bacteroidaceae bacterium]
MKKVTSENVQEYLARYMEGDSTQEELRLLKEYFGNTKDLPAELRPYAQMFAVLEEKAQTPSVEALDRFAEGQVPARRKHLPLWPMWVAACIAAFAVVFLTPPKHEENMAIAYVDGKMIRNDARAMQIGKEALQEIFNNGDGEQQLTELFNAK